ncbi:uncharacterized protein [Mycetomoellerius zeteki]|uniref:uncharacterized protein n=1 Tax=Mycetomoellerius zeteki TaxID=64791 RepID=UPI00084E70E5|nr:PREDICTED: uncharacterized protein LOC108727401 [Trachymyrmex zeteki]
MSFFDNRYYYLNKRFLAVIGQWPFQSRLEGNMMFTVACLFIVSLTALEFWGLAAGITDLNIIMENTSPLLVNSFIIIKILNCMFTNDKMKKFLEDIEETWKIKHTDAEKKILQHYAEESRIFTIRYAFGLYAMWLFYTTSPIIISGIYTLLLTNETYSARFLYRLEHVLDIDKYFKLLMLHGFISVFYIVSVPIAVDTTFTLCIQHICALFECLRFSDVLSSNYATSFLFLLGNVIVSLSFGAAEIWGLVAGITDLNIIMENASPLLVDCFMMLKLINCAFTNNKIKELLKAVEETWKIKHTGPEKEILQHYAEKSKIFAIRYAIVFYAAWLFYTLTSVVISGVYKILPTNKTYEARYLYRLEHVLDMDKYFNLMMLHGFISVFYIVSVPIAVDTTFTLCIQHICALFECLRYSCDWYKISMRSKDLLRFTLLRTTKPCQIKAGKLFVMSMENFSSLLKMTMSYFTMLTSVQ